MSTTFVSQTPLSLIRPVVVGLRPSREQLIEALRSALPPGRVTALAPVFAEAVAAEDRAAIDWYSTLIGTPTPLRDLPPDEQVRLLEQLGAVRAEIQAARSAISDDRAKNQAARILDAAVLVPDNQDYIYSIEGEPVLVAWGYQLAPSESVAQPFGLLRPRAEVSTNHPPLSADSREAGVAIGVSEAELQTREQDTQERGSRVGWLAWLLWAVFFALLFAILYLLLTACSLGLPSTQLASRIGIFNHCTSQQQSSTANLELERQSALRELVREAQIELAQQTQSCHANRVRESEPLPSTQSAHPQKNPQGTLTDHEPVDPDTSTVVQEALDEGALTEARNRSVEAGAAEGALQIILDWDGPADLDLIVICEALGDRISYETAHTVGCNNGKLDVDANRYAPMTSPVEHIAWEQIPDGGPFKVYVQNAKNFDDPRPAIPFRVHILKGDEEQAFSGSVGERQSVAVTEITTP